MSKSQPENGSDGSLQPGPEHNAPDSSSCALILLDIINTFDFDDGEKLFKRALPMAKRLKELKERCHRRGIPAVYVNDHFGRWRSDFSTLVKDCKKEGFRGREILECLQPESHDYFVFKPMYSGFYQTTLELLLLHFGARTLIVTGLASNICVLCTANDAHMRRYKLWLPRDGMAAATQAEQDYAELHFEKVLSADVRPIAEMRLDDLLEKKIRHGARPQETTGGGSARQSQAW
jgi:nicotinamidase-related amidase